MSEWADVQMFGWQGMWRPRAIVGFNKAITANRQLITANGIMALSCQIKEPKQFFSFNI
jgi:hypothetical protein